jgi:hypothetical protein
MSVILLSVVMLSVVMLNVVAPYSYFDKYFFFEFSAKIFFVAFSEKMRSPRRDDLNSKNEIVNYLDFFIS